MNASIATPVTAEELLRLPYPDKQVELVRGEVVVREPPAAWHGGISNRVAYRLTRFADEHELGAVFGQDTSFQIAADPDTVRAPDVAFVRAERLAEIPRRGYLRLAPDLVVEMLSPDDRPGEVRPRGRAGSGASPRRQPRSARGGGRSRRRRRASRLPVPGAGPPDARLVAPGGSRAC